MNNGRFPSARSQQRRRKPSFVTSLLCAVSCLAVAFCFQSCGGSSEEELRLARSYYSRALVEEQLFHSKTADSLFEISTQLFQSNNSLIEASDAGDARALMQFSLGNYNEALNYATRASEFAQQSGNKSAFASTILFIGTMQNQLGRMNEAQNTAEQSLTISQRAKDTLRMIKAYSMLGTLSMSQGRHNSAAQAFTQTRSLAEAIDDKSEFLNAGLNLCQEMMEEGKISEAVQLLDSLKNQIDVDSSLQYQWHILQAKCYGKANNYVRCAYEYNRAFEIQSDGPPAITALIGCAYSNLKARQNTDALRICSSLLALDEVKSDRLIMAAVLLCKGRVEAIHTPVSNADLKTALEMFSYMEHPIGIILASESLGIIAENSGNLNLAAEYYRKGFEEQQKSIFEFYDLHHRTELFGDFASSLPDMGDNLARVLILLKRIPEAFIAHEQVLLQRFAATSRVISLRPNQSSLQSEYDQIQQLSGEILALRRQKTDEIGKTDLLRDDNKIEHLSTLIEERMSSYKQAAESIEKLEPNSSLLFHPLTIPIEQVQQRLAANTTLLEYSAADQIVFCFVLTKNSLTAFRLTAQYQTILQQAAELQKKISTPVPPRDQGIPANDTLFGIETILRTLHSELLAAIPVSTQRLIIVPTPELSLLPFHALAGSSEQQIQFAVERFMIRYLPFAQAALFQANQKRTIADISEVGFTAVSRWEVDYVLRDVRSFYKDAKFIFDLEATPENLLNQSGDVLHLATEFYYDEDYPSNSFIALSDGKISNGIIYKPIGLLHSLNHFPVIILMNSGSTIEGINQFHLGLLLMNGSRAVIGTFWSPERASVRLFDEQLYNSFVGNFEPGDAYYQAQREMISTPTFRSPHQWAPFFFYGIQ